MELAFVAGEFEERADWRAAESAYNQILALSELESAIESKAHSDLAGLCRLLGRDLEALGHSRCATAAARRADLTILLAMALQGKTCCLVRFGEFGEAENTIAEAISAIGDDPMCNQMRASLLTLRAECNQDERGITNGITKGCNGGGKLSGLTMVALSRQPAEPCRSVAETDQP